MNPDFLRYSCQIALPGFSESAQILLQRAKVLVIGAGGLGCPSAQYLTAAGVGTLGIADFDVISISNLHRQVLFTPAEAGKKKAIVACEKLQLQNPGIKLVLSHGGAAIPTVMGRLKKSYLGQPTPGDPAEGFKKLYFDTVVFDPAVLRFVVEAGGVDKMMMGTDYPFYLGDLEPLKIVDACGFTDKDLSAIVAGTAARLFNIR